MDILKGATGVMLNFGQNRAVVKVCLGATRCKLRNSSPQTFHKAPKQLQDLPRYVNYVIRSGNVDWISSLFHQGLVRM